MVKKRSSHLLYLTISARCHQYQPAPDHRFVRAAGASQQLLFDGIGYRPAMGQIAGILSGQAQHENPFILFRAEPRNRAALEQIGGPGIAALDALPFRDAA